MSKVFKGRYTAAMEGDLVVFLIGVRNMPSFGLAKATEHVPATGRRETARRRLGGDSEPATATTY